MSDPILKIEGLNKHFGSTHANKDISLTLSRGEIRGLAGENGSGKSTLGSILAGIYTADSGSIYKDGKPYSPKSPIDASSQRVGIVVQELGMVKTLPIGINIFLGRLGQFKKAGVLHLRAVYAAGEAHLRQWKLSENVPLRDLAGSHSVETRKLAELARALSVDPDILIVDEVTQALSQDKRSILHEILYECKRQGKAVLLITHDLDEMLEVSDSVTVMRDGAVVDTKPSAQIDVDALKRMMVGREITSDYYREDKSAGFEDEVVLEVRGLTGEDCPVEDVSFDLHKGEILAICGLSDAGIHDLGGTILGLKKRKRGTVRIQPSGVEIKRPNQAMRNGFCYVPKDRDADAMMLQASVMDNICMPSARELSGGMGFMGTRRMRELTGEGIKRFNVKCTGAGQITGGLSGGNKQKINLGRWLLKETKIFVLDCPTRGVDVGVKAYIYHILKQARQSGLSIILISDELTEAVGMADRVLVMKNGRAAGIIPRSPELSEDAIIEVML